MDQKVSWERAERLRSGADDAASLTHKIYVTFLLLGTYIGIIIGSTTDEQLLKISPVTLPLLDVGLPILWFYAFVPWLFVLFHFNLLLQCYLLARKLHLLDAAIDALEDESAQTEQRVRLYAFPFSHMLIGRHHGWLMRGLLELIVWVTMVLLPLILLLWAQMRFLPYQSKRITVFQGTAVIADLAMLWFFWPKIVTRSHNARDWRKRIIPNLMQFGKRWGQRATKLWKQTLPGAVQSVKRGCFYILAKPLPPMQKETKQITEDPERLGKEPAERARGVLVLTLASLAALLVFLVSVEWLSLPGISFPCGLQLAEKTLVDGNPSAEVLSMLKSEEKDKREKGLEKIQGLILTNRDLRFADFRGALLPKADLRGANLDDANIRGAKIFAGDLSSFELSKGERCVNDAQLVFDEDRGHCRTNLQTIHLWEAQLQGANLTGAQIQGVSWWHVQLQGANLTGAQLPGASLRKAQLQGANLRHAWLPGANLQDAQLQGTDLRGAWLQGANLQDAQLQGADLRGAKLQGADLTNAQLQGADLGYSEIGGAKLAAADLRLTILLYLQRTPLDQNTYERITEELLIKDVRDEKLRARILDPIKKAVGEPVRLNTAHSAMDAFCDVDHIGKPFIVWTPELADNRFTCFTQDTIEIYFHKRAQFLKELGGVLNSGGKS